mmetsp:Transcript_46633/g.141273  ORF Transcript_46633/g.141273 Transcript_46633/m.141273 type:complete len:302 (-) Transcript_46633:1554-2459(-)
MKCPPLQLTRLLLKRQLQHLPPQKRRQRWPPGNRLHRRLPHQNHLRLRRRRLRFPASPRRLPVRRCAQPGSAPGHGGALLPPHLPRRLPPPLPRHRDHRLCHCDDRPRHPRACHPGPRWHRHPRHWNDPRRSCHRLRGSRRHPRLCQQPARRQRQTVPSEQPPPDRTTSRLRRPGRNRLRGHLLDPRIQQWCRSPRRPRQKKKTKKRTRMRSGARPGGECRGRRPGGRGSDPPPHRGLHRRDHLERKNDQQPRGTGTAIRSAWQRQTRPSRRPDPQRTIASSALQGMGSRGAVAKMVTLHH